MDRFLSNTINRVDKKGRVSIPAGFRTVLAGQSTIHLIMGIEHPVVEAGGPQFMDANLKRLEAMDPFSLEYEMWSFHLLGEADEIRLDGEGSEDEEGDPGEVTAEASGEGLAEDPGDGAEAGPPASP